MKRRTKAKTKSFNFFILLAILFFGSLPLFPSPLDDAAALEKNRDYAGAFKHYTEYLTTTPDSSDFFSILLHAVDINPDVAESINFLRSNFPRLKSSVYRGRAKAKLAALLELSGDYEAAQKSYEEAYFENPKIDTLSYLFMSASLLFELGEFDRSEEQARIAANLSTNPGLKKKSVFLMSRIFAATGREEDALRAAELLTEDASNAEGNEAILYFLFDLAGQTGKPEEQASFLSRLSKEFPASAEYDLAKGTAAGKGRVKFLPVPSRMLSGPSQETMVSAKSEETKATAEETKQAVSTDKTVPTGIQTGSFSVRENAEYLRKDLEKLGFVSVVQEVPESDNKTKGKDKGASTNYDEIVFFDKKNKRITYYNGEVQESLVWLSSYRTIYRGLFINTTNEAIASISIQLSISVTDMNSIDLQIKGGEGWDGSYKRLSKELQTAYLSSKRKSVRISPIDLNGLYRNENGLEIYFSSPDFTMRENGSEVTGGFVVYSLDGDVLELKIMKKNGLVESSRTYRMTFSEELQGKRTVRNLVLQPAVVSITGIDVKPGGTIKLQQIVEPKS